MKIIVFGFVFLISACGVKQSSSKTKDIQDIYSMMARPDGLFDVKCRNGAIEVRTVTQIRLGQVCVTQPPPPQHRLSCVARDGDNARPWIFNLVSNGQVLRLPTALFASIDQCNKSINERMMLPNLSMGCISRDGDDAKPWQLFTLQGTDFQKLPVMYSSRDECQTSLKTSSRSGGRSLLCVSRDADNARPWVIYSVGVTEAVRQETLFATLAECQTVIR